MTFSGSPQDKICFGPFELDVVNRELRKRGNAVKLQPQQFVVLVLLARRAGQIVSRDEIHQHVWGTDTFVDFERGINFSINQIRAALGDDAGKPRFIETIPRRGYRFIHPIEVSGEPQYRLESSASAEPAGIPGFSSGGRVSSAMVKTAMASAADAGINQPTRGIRWKVRKWMISSSAVA